MSTNSPSPAVPGERISLRLIVETVPDEEMAGVKFPGGEPILDADLAYAVQAAEEAFAAALRGTRTIVSAQHRLVRVEADVPSPLNDPEF
jgi:organic radical activating enzyme